MAAKNLSEKETKALQVAHTEYRQAVGSKILTTSKMKEYFKALGRRSEAGLEEELSDIVYKAMWKAVMRCDGNNRNTVKDVDI